MSFNEAAGSGDWAGCIKMLDAELKATATATPMEAPLRLALLLNRGYCLQKLMLNRKALKASGKRSGCAFVSRSWSRQDLAPHRT
jgi:hypothetical protein